MAIENIDGFGHKRDRQGVRAVQRHHSKSERLKSAQDRRDRRNARRANGPNVIVLCEWPKEGSVTRSAPDGAYIWQGEQPDKGKWQIVVVGPLKGSVDDYRAAASAWLVMPLQIASTFEMECDNARGFLSIILEPETA